MTAEAADDEDQQAEDEVDSPKFQQLEAVVAATLKRFCAPRLSSRFKQPWFFNDRPYAHLIAKIQTRPLWLPESRQDVSRKVVIWLLASWS